jgi:hypothetical protein
VAALPLVRVRFLSDGHEAHINESDFDPALHERWVHMRSAEPTSPGGSGEPEPPKPAKGKKGAK